MLCSEVSIRHFAEKALREEAVYRSRSNDTRQRALQSARRHAWSECHVSKEAGVGAGDAHRHVIRSRVTVDREIDRGTGSPQVVRDKLVHQLGFRAAQCS